MAASLCTMVFYFMQIVKDGQLILPSWSVIMGPILQRRQSSLENQDELSPRSLMSISASTDGFLIGMGKVFPALIILTLAWACGAIMIEAGADRLVARIISNRVDPRYLPTISLVLSFVITPALGSSWGTLSIMIPLLLVPAYKVSNGDPAIVYATIGALLSGGVAGDQISPISDTCVVSALACSCDLMNHVSTQAPYVTVVTLFSILVGTLPAGCKVWPNAVSLLVGMLLMVIFAFAGCAKVINKSGKFDLATEFVLTCFPNKSQELDQLRRDTSLNYYNLNPAKNDESSETEAPSSTLSCNKLNVDDDGIEVRKLYESQEP